MSEGGKFAQLLCVVSTTLLAFYTLHKTSACDT